ncbi:hypothetical protein Tco_1006215 [Tanacetum coccineum]|uniref:Uncharacterized protein n=1 Tax=Tanacetum coccineum TaxID=301880 RepID=A0ABQ5FJ01_9ASTR
MTALHASIGLKSMHNLVISSKSAPTDFNDFLAFTAVDMSAVGPEEQILNQPDNIPDDVDTENQGRVNGNNGLKNLASSIADLSYCLMANCDDDSILVLKQYNYLVTG